MRPLAAAGVTIPCRRPVVSAVFLSLGVALLLMGAHDLAVRDGAAHPSLWQLLSRLSAAPVAAALAGTTSLGEGDGAGSGGGGSGGAAAAPPPLAAPPPGAAWRDPSAAPLQTVTSDHGAGGGGGGGGGESPTGRRRDDGRADAGAQSRNLYSVVDMSTSHAPEAGGSGADGAGGTAAAAAGGAAGAAAASRPAGDGGAPPRPCKNTVAGPEYVTDDRGYTCAVEGVRADAGRRGCCALLPTAAAAAAAAATPRRGHPPPPLRVRHVRRGVALL